MRTVIQLCLAYCLAANNILLMHEWNYTFLLVAIALEWKWQIASLLKIVLKKQTRWLNDKTIIEKYRVLSVSRTSVIYLSLRLWQIIDLLATDKSQYFAQPRPIIVNYLHEN